MTTAHGASSNGQQTGTSSWSATRLVAEREINAQIRTKGFWFTFGLLIAGIVAATILPNVFGGGGGPTIATVGAEAARAVETADFDVRDVADVQTAEELVRSEDVDAAVVPDGSGESPLDLRVIALSSEPGEVVAALSVAPAVDLLEPSDVSEAVQFFVTFSFALIFFIFAIGFGMAIAQSIVTEKQTRIVEILVATVPVRAMLAGKIAGHSMLVFAQVAVLVVITPLALRAGEQGPLLAMIGGALGWFVPFFILGFVLLAAMWAVAGAVVSRQEDLGSSTSLVMTLVMLPYFGVIFFNDNPLAMTIMSYVPFSAAVAMPVRLFSDAAAVWEPFVSLAILGATLVICVLVASRLYSGSLLQTSGRVKLARAWAQSD